MLSTDNFQKQFLRLILIAWTVPAVIGLSFLVFIKMFTLDQVVDILTSPIEPFFIVGSLFAAYWYFKSLSEKICHAIENPTKNALNEAINVISHFPIQFWSAFLIYLIVAPITVIYSAEFFSDFTAQPIDWFRINLVSLIVSIIVGLPIFFLIIDLFGRMAHKIPFTKPIISLKLKVILIGALVPLLIDTMLVQYYWTRTGFFDTETFIIWLALEALAVAGSLVFAKSFGQSLQPLQYAITDNSLANIDLEKDMQPNSIDELGILTNKYREILQNLNNQQEILEDKVIERTDKLDTVNKELEAFSYSVSHDLRASIRSIDGFCQVLLEDASDKLNKEEVKYLNKIKRSANRMAEITNDLLALSKINQHTLNLKDVELSIYVMYQLELLKNEDPMREVKTDITHNLTTTADEGLAKILIENLVNNAWKYTRGSKETKIDFGFDEEKQAYFIRDNGVGFDMKYSKDLFVPFRRLHADNKFEGSGIGLATALRIVRKHGGKIWADAEVDKGSTFYFKL